MPDACNVCCTRSTASRNPHIWGMSARLQGGQAGIHAWGHEGRTLPIREAKPRPARQSAHQTLWGN